MSNKQLLLATSALFLSASSLGAFCATALAQEQAQGGLEEITVTARKISENLMQVPLAISALTAADIENSGMKNLIDLGKETPGLFASVSGNGRDDRSATKLVFRGLSITSGLIFIDGSPYGGNDTPDLSDVSRVEVLKGPQSAYFGRSTYSGAVNYVTREPSTDKFHGQFSAEVSQYGGNVDDASLEGPIAGDKLSFRISGHHYYTAGQYPNPLEGDRLGQEQTNALKFYLTAKPSDQFKVSTFLSYALDDDGPATEAVLLARTINGATTTKTGGELQCSLGGTGGPYYCGELHSLSYYYPANPLFVSQYDRTDPILTARLINNVPVPSAQFVGNQTYPYPFNPDFLKHVGLKRQTETAHVKMEYETQSGWSLDSITAWDRTKFDIITDANYRDASTLPNLAYNPATSPAAYIPAFDEHFTQLASLTTDISQEIRVTSPVNQRLRGVAGASFLGIYNPGSGLNGFGLSGTVQNAYSKTGVRTPAVFAAGYFDIMQNLTLTAEGRYQWDGITAHQLFPVSFAKLSNTFTSFSPRVSLDYKYADNSDVYALWSRGYRPGGFNTALVGNVASVIAQLVQFGGSLTYAQEQLDNYELGLKSTWLNNHLQTTLAVYDDVWKNGQVGNTIFVTLPNGSISGQGVTVNLGRVNLKGAEFEARLAATQHLTITGSLNFMHNIIDNYNDSADGLKINGSTNQAGNHLPQAPDWTASLSPQYTDHLVGEWDWFTRADWTYRGSYYIDPTNVAWTAPVNIVNVHVGVQNDAFRVEVYANNLFNNLQFADAVGGSTTLDTIQNNVTGNALRVGVPLKRVVGIKGSYKF